MLNELQGKTRHDGDVPIEYLIDWLHDFLEASQFYELEVGEDYEVKIGLGEINGVDDFLEREAAFYEDEDFRLLGAVGFD